jgi:hypothetical protein
METEINKMHLCFSCHANVPDINGEVHKYMDAAPGCWRLFGKILEREFSYPEYKTNSRLTTDAYAIQHYGKSDVPQAVKSVNHHLLSLCFYFEYQFSVQQSDLAFRKLAVHKEKFIWLIPPNHVGHITVADVVKAETAQQHMQLVEEWSYAAWMAWKEHHNTIKVFIQEHYVF